MSSNVATDVSGGSGAVLTAQPLCEDTWLIRLDGSTGYLVVGEDRGVMIDTGFGTENVQAFVQTLTDKPVDWVANTHGHFDHTGGNGWFELSLHERSGGRDRQDPLSQQGSADLPAGLPHQGGRRRRQDRIGRSRPWRS